MRDGMSISSLSTCFDGRRDFFCESAFNRVEDSTSIMNEVRTSNLLRVKRRSDETRNDGMTGTGLEEAGTKLRFIVLEVTLEAWSSSQRRQSFITLHGNYPSPPYTPLLRLLYLHAIEPLWKT